MKEQGKEIAKGIHGCLYALCYPVIAICVGRFVWLRYGWELGIVSGVASWILSAWGISKFNDPKGLSVLDCLLPLFVSCISGIVFLPFALFSGNLFSPATCIASGLLLSMHLLAYRAGRITSPWWLIWPTLTFVYELLPIDLPTDIDNLLGFGINTLNYLCSAAKLKNEQLIKDDKTLGELEDGKEGSEDKNDEDKDDVIDV